MIRMLLCAMAVASISACGGSGETAAPPPATAPISFQVIENQQSSFMKSMNLVIRDQSTYADAWAQHTKHHADPAAAPSVDFNTSMVLVVIETGLNGCFSLAITQVFQTEKNTTLEYQTTGGKSGVACTQSVVWPSSWIVVPRQEGEVVFVHK